MSSLYTIVVLVAVTALGSIGAATLQQAAFASCIFTCSQAAMGHGEDVSAVARGSR